MVEKAHVAQINSSKSPVSSATNGVFVFAETDARIGRSDLRRRRRLRRFGGGRDGVARSLASKNLRNFEVR